jgi:hypothetical protein
MKNCKTPLSQVKRVSLKLGPVPLAFALPNISAALVSMKCAALVQENAESLKAMVKLETIYRILKFSRLDFRTKMNKSLQTNAFPELKVCI